MGADQIRPEEMINGYAKARAGARNIVSAFGVLALLWSTVVVLGGFVSILRMKDFWFLTILSFIMACKVTTLLDIKNADIYVAEAEILRAMHAHSAREDCSETPMMSALVAAKYILVLCVTTAFGSSTYVCFAISVARLIQRDYGDAGGDAANKAKLGVALDIFYVLVLIQTTFRIYWTILSSQDLCTPVSEACGFAGWGPKLVRRYEADTQVRCNKDEPLPRDWNLIKYAVVLLESASLDDRLSGARVLDTLMEQGIVVRKELLSSRQSVQNLMDMIDSRGGTAHDGEIRERAGRIVAHIASDLLTTQFPGVLRCLCSLLEAFHPSAGIEQTLDLKSSSVALQALEQGGVHLSVAIPDRTGHQQLDRKVPWYGGAIDVLFHRAPAFRRGSYTFVSKGTKELISQGLLILERLTEDQDNCTAICNHPRLLSKITSPITTHQHFSNNAYDQTWTEMLGRSLTVMGRLITSPGDGVARLCHMISCNPVAARNLMDILVTDSKGAQELRVQALEILTELAFEDSFRKLPFDESLIPASIMEEFIQILGRIFFEDQDCSGAVDRLKRKRVTRKAGEALARLLGIPGAISSTDALINSGADGYGSATDLTHREGTCASNMLAKVLRKMLSTKTETRAAAVTEDVASNGSSVETAPQSQPEPPPEDVDSIQPSTQETEEQSEERKLIAAMLSVTVVICTKHEVSEDDLALAVPEDAALVKKLKEIIEINQDIKPDCLRIVKLSCHVVIRLAKLKPSWVTEFNRHNFKKVLSETAKTLSDLDNCMIFAGDDREVTKPVMSLPTLVKEAQRAILPGA